MTDFRNVLRGALALAVAPGLLDYQWVPGSAHPAFFLPVFAILLVVLTVHRRKGLALDPFTQWLGILPLALGALMLVAETMAVMPLAMGMGVEGAKAAPDWLALTALALDSLVTPLPAAIVFGYAVACLVESWRPVAGVAVFLPVAFVSQPDQWWAGSVELGLLHTWGVVAPLLVGGLVAWLMAVGVDRMVGPVPGRVAAEGAFADG